MLRQCSDKVMIAAYHVPIAWHITMMVVCLVRPRCLCSQLEICSRSLLLGGLSGSLSSQSNGFQPFVLANVVPCVWPPGSCHAASGQKQ